MGRSTFANMFNLTCKPILDASNNTIDNWKKRAASGNYFVKRQSYSGALSPDSPRVYPLASTNTAVFGRLIAAGGNDDSDAWVTVQICGIAEIDAAGTAGALSNAQYDDYLSADATNVDGAPLMTIPSTQPTTGARNIKVIGGTVTKPRVIWNGFVTDIN